MISFSAGRRRSDASSVLRALRAEVDLGIECLKAPFLKLLSWIPTAMLSARVTFILVVKSMIAVGDLSLLLVLAMEHSGSGILTLS